MSNQTIIYNRKRHKSRDIVSYHKQGFDVLCPVCQSKLIFITSLEEAKVKDPGHPGIFCPTSPDHVYTTFNIGSREMWKNFDREVAELKTQKKQIS